MRSNPNLKLFEVFFCFKALQSWGPLAPSPSSFAVAAHTHTHAAAEQGCFEECEPCFGVDSFSPGRGPRASQLHGSFEPFSSYVLHHSTTEPPSAAARYTIRRRCHRLPIVSGACSPTHVDAIPHCTFPSHSRDFGCQRDAAAELARRRRRNGFP